MPRTYKKKRVQRRGNRQYRGGRRGKKYIKRRKMNYPTTNIQRTIGFADRQFVKMRQVFDVGAVAGANNITYYITPSRIYTPLADGFGEFTSPQAFPVWQQFYTFAMAKGCKVKVRVSAGETATPVSFTVWPTSVQPLTITPDSADYLAGQPYSKQRVIGYPAGGHDVSTINHYMSTKKILGYNYSDLTNLSASMPAGGSPISPPQLWYFGVNIQTLDGVSDLDHYMFLDVTYYVEFYDRRDTTFSN